MESLFQQLVSDQIFDFHGGIHPPERKHLSNHRPIGRLPLAPGLVVPLKQHIGEAGEPLVAVGDTVLKGQPLSRPLSIMSVPVHAPTSGTVVAIEKRPVVHPSGLWDSCIVIQPDGRETWCERHPVKDPFAQEPAALLKVLKEAGLSGLGGAGFPTAVKLGGGRPIEALILNAAECEPYITADDVLLREHAEEVMTGARLLARIVGAGTIVIGIEDNKPEAISTLQPLVDADEQFHLKVVPTKYPSGSERQLIELLTGQQVPAGGIPADLGLVMQNVGTAYAACKAIMDGEPLIERVVTITGERVQEAGNYWLPLGTPVSHALSACDFKADQGQRLIIGGPMMGYTLHDSASAVTKTVNCLLAPSRAELPVAGEEMNCIRCGACADVCPADLLPQQLYWYAKAQDHDKLAEHSLSACIECGACAYVCPSEIPLVQYYRIAKAEIRDAEAEKRKSEKAKDRFEARKARLEREKAERAEKHRLAAEKRKQAMAAKDKAKEADAVAAALARVKAKQADDLDTAKARAAEGAHRDTSGELVPDNTEMARLREERKRQARERRAAQAEAQPETGDKKAAVAAAIARAKARKASQAEPEVKDQAKADDKKAAVAAAIARAKARKAAQAEPEAKEEAKADDKKAAVAAAIARAKAKKAAQEDNES
ncbi:electron transport complex subunit RsxC [Gallaecimonas sp. GXIMD4217]|uniref:electron transport complex subunit RsxC n=1 Tax=Gallaecimonas sp. GXIMD4217 TaxID=3131927 RepID=UPI00311AF5D1